MHNILALVFLVIHYVVCTIAYLECNLFIEGACSLGLDSMVIIAKLLCLVVALLLEGRYCYVGHLGVGNYTFGHVGLQLALLIRCEGCITKNDNIFVCHMCFFLTVFLFIPALWTPMILTLLIWFRSGIIGNAFMSSLINHIKSLV